MFNLSEIADINYPFLTTEIPLKKADSIVEDKEDLEGQWMKDSETVQCASCRTKFSLTKRKVLENS